MRNMQKLRLVEDESLEKLRDAILSHSQDEDVVAIMLKDAHLVEAALATDRRIAAGDETARGHFARLAASFGIIRPINWVNPTIEDEQIIAWIEHVRRSSAPDGYGLENCGQTALGESISTTCTSPGP